MSHKYLKNIALLGFCLMQISAFAQVSANSPYSRFGIGNLNGLDFVHLQSMGSISTAYWDDYQTNLANPASLAKLKATSFETGFDASRSYLSTDSEKADFWGGSMNYLSLSFPILNPLNRVLDRKTQDINWGMNISLQPFSRVNTTSRLLEDLENIGGVTREFEGSGGLNQVSFGNGFKYKNFHAGVSLAYIFGQIQQERSVLYNDLPLALNIYSLDKFSFRGYTWRLGIQYDLDLSDGQWKEDLSKTNLITFGLTLGTQSSLTTIADQFRSTRSPLWNGLNDVNFNQAEVDTILNLEGTEERGNLPGSIGLGVFWKKGDRWSVGVNFVRAGWSAFESTILEGTLDDAMRMSMGAEFTPDPNSYRYYHHKMKYRAGLTFAQDPRLIDGNQLREINLNLGVGLPIFLSRQISFINLGIEYASLGGDVPITENTVRFKMGVTLNNNLWFYKRKYN